MRCDIVEIGMYNSERKKESPQQALDIEREPKVSVDRHNTCEIITRTKKEKIRRGKKVARLNKERQESGR